MFGKLKKAFAPKIDRGNKPDQQGCTILDGGRVVCSIARDCHCLADKRVVQTICSMFHSEAYTRGYMPDTPLGKIAREGFLHWMRLHNNVEYMAQWVKLSDMFPQKGDLTARGEILAKDKDGFSHVCDPFNCIERDGHTEWFNGDRYIIPEWWMKIPEK